MLTGALTLRFCFWALERRGAEGWLTPLWRSHRSVTYHGASIFFQLSLRNGLFVVEEEVSEEVLWHQEKNHMLNGEQINRQDLGRTYIKDGGSFWFFNGENKMLLASNKSKNGEGCPCLKDVLRTQRIAPGVEKVSKLLNDVSSLEKPVSLVLSKAFKHKYCFLKSHIQIQVSWAHRNGIHDPRASNSQGRAGIPPPGERPARGHLRAAQPLI